MSSKTQKKKSANTLFKEADEKWHAGAGERRLKKKEELRMIDLERSPLFAQIRAAKEAKTKIKALDKKMRTLIKKFDSNEEKLSKKYRRNWYLYNPDPKLRSGFN